MLKPVEKEREDMRKLSSHAAVRLRVPTPDDISEVQNDLIGRLQQLVADGLLTHIDIAVWGPAIEATPPDPTDPSSAREMFLEFDHWARSHGYTLAPAFYRRTAGSLVDEYHPEIIMCPLICLGIYKGETVDAVYPYSDGDRVYTIHDGIKELESQSKEDHQKLITSEPLHLTEQTEATRAAVEEE